jgi:type II secretory ATPase GspE/PulE/Tfp pilus assembly ATPase PilB-like protein
MDIERVAVEQGMTTMLQDATSKILQGITTVEEVRRVIEIEAERQAEAGTGTGIE